MDVGALRKKKKKKKKKGYKDGEGGKGYGQGGKGPNEEAGKGGKSLQAVDPVCEVCFMFARVPFICCRFCKARPSYHHGRCCYRNPANNPEDWQACAGAGKGGLNGYRSHGLKYGHRQPDCRGKAADKAAAKDIQSGNGNRMLCRFQIISCPMLGPRPRQSLK